MGSSRIFRSFLLAACTGNNCGYNFGGVGVLRISNDPAVFQVLIDFMREDKYIMQRFVCSMY